MTEHKELSGNPLFRLAVIVCCCLLTFGSYYCYDIPGAMTTSLESQYEITQAQYSMFYTVYSVPNTVLPLCTGFLIDRIFGFRLGGMIACTCILLGQIIWAASSLFIPNMSAYYAALVGRFVFGLGGETLSVVQSGYCAKWFTSKELALAFGITLSFSRIGSAINFFLTPAIDDYGGVKMVLWFGVSLCFISLLSCVALSVLDYFGEKSAAESKKAETEKVELRDILHLPINLWLLAVVCVFFYVCVFSFITISGAEFTYEWRYSSIAAGATTAIPYLLAALICPFAGYFIDKVGRNMYWVLGAVFATGYAHFLLFSAPHGAQFAPVIGMLVIGVSYTVCAAALWPSVALLVDGHLLGTAYGTMTAVQNTGLAIIPLCVALITNNPADPHYRYAELFFTGCALIAVATCIVLIVIDKMRNKILTSSATIQRELLAAKAAEKSLILNASSDEP